MKTIADVQARQNEYDAQYWQHQKSDEKIRHILLHLVKLTGKLAAYSEAREHGTEVSTEQIKSEVVPDLQVYAAQLANLFDIDLNKAHQDRLEANIKRLHSG